MYNLKNVQLESTIYMCNVKNVQLVEKIWNCNYKTTVQKLTAGRAGRQTLVLSSVIALGRKYLYLLSDGRNVCILS